MLGMDDLDLTGHWAGLSVFVRLVEEGTELSSPEVATLLQTRNVKGIGASLSGTRRTLSAAGIRMEEAVVRRTVRGRSVWKGGPRIRQAIHVLEQERYQWTGHRKKDGIPVEDALPGDQGPVLVLRALRSRGEAYKFIGGMAELDEVLDDDRAVIGESGYRSIEEIFIARIEPGKDGKVYQVPDGYGENGIWVRGEHDYAETRVPGAIGTGRWPTLSAWVGEATWVERRIALVDACRQVAGVRAESWLLLSEEAVEMWQGVEPEHRFRYVKWISAYRHEAPFHTPPLRMRLRCWYDVVIETKNGRRIVLREEGLRGDDERTAKRAVARWRKERGKWTDEPIEVCEFRISKRQPRPLPTDP